MNTSAEHDYIKSYELGVKAVQANPKDLDAQHKVVLSLARLGALDLALAEYSRLGLDKVTGHEDIMALAGRLRKDLYLRSTGAKAASYAESSALKYDAAFQNTRGYYSGINAATMTLMAGMAEASVKARAQGILENLPLQENLTPTDHYFVEATRAEAFLLRGDIRKAKTTLKEAVAFDPLNYTAHAATLKQFQMILDKLEQERAWITELSPPRPIHYAGHINMTLPEGGERALSSTISDYLQQNDVGSGFGALAAGSDIIIAETLLAEGADLHVILPCEADVFLAQSVTPFGDDWGPRHINCLKQAKSVTIAAKSAPWPNAQLYRFAGQFAMGQAALKARTFGVVPMQLLIWDEKDTGSYTALHAADWNMTQKEQRIISVQTSAAAANTDNEIVGAFPSVLQSSRNKTAEKYETVSKAMMAALRLHERQESARLALHIDIPGENSDDILQKMLNHSGPQSIVMSEAFASLLAHFENSRFDISFAGLIPLSAEKNLRCYVLNSAV